MLKITVQVPKLKLPTMTRADWIRIGGKALQTITSRLEKAVGVNDRRMKRLSPAYKERKQRMGAKGIRNLMFSGSMLGSLGVVHATNSRVELGPTRRSELIKMQANQNRDAWWGISKKDEEIISEFAKSVIRGR